MDTSARLLRLLAMLSSRGSWRGTELATRLEVTERSIRRDITRLRDLGYPVDSITGVHGGLLVGRRRPAAPHCCSTTTKRSRSRSRCTTSPSDRPMRSPRRR